MLVSVNMGDRAEVMKLSIVTRRLAVVIGSKNGEYDPFPGVAQTEHRQAISVVVFVVV